MRDHVSEHDLLVLDSIPADLSEHLIQANFTLPLEALDLVRRGEGSANVLGLVAGTGSETR